MRLGGPSIGVFIASFALIVRTVIGSPAYYARMQLRKAKKAIQM